MRYDPDCHHRRSVRLRGYDYAQAGAYFVTVCVQGRECLLGEVTGAAVALSPFGRMVDAWWDDLPRRFPSLDLDASVVMPNHMHGIVVLTEPTPVGAGAPRPGLCKDENAPSAPHDMSPVKANLPRPTLGQVVAYFKYQSTTAVNHTRGTAGVRLWQRSFHDHVIRSDACLERLRNYVAENPLRWELDQLHPDHPSKW